MTKGSLEADSYHLNEAADFNELITTAACIAYGSLHPISRWIMALCSDKEFDADYEIKEHICKGIEGKKQEDTIYLGNHGWIRSLG